MQRQSKNFTLDECAQILLLVEGWKYRRITERFVRQFPWASRFTILRQNKNHKNVRVVLNQFDNILEKIIYNIAESG